MENDAKKENDKQNTKFLVPFSPNTPRIEKDYNSSVFFTPPYSNEGPTSSSRWAPTELRRNEKIPFDLSLSIDVEEITDRFDIIRGLGDKSMAFTVCNIIFGYLDDISLCRASQVSKTWRNIIHVENHESKKRVREFLSKQKEHCSLKGKENVGLQKRTYNAAQSIMENTPEMNTPKIFKSNSGCAKPGDFHKLEKEKYRPCPKCSSPAKIDGKKIAAKCSNCHEQFCLNCFRKWDDHNSELCSLSKSKTQPSPQKGKQKKFVAGTTQSRNRLRRLTPKRK